MASVCSKTRARLSTLSYSLRVRKMAECVTSALPRGTHCTKDGHSEPVHEERRRTRLELQ